MSVTRGVVGVGAAPAQADGTDNPPTDIALPTPAAALPMTFGMALGTAPMALAISGAALAACGSIAWLRPWMSLNEVVKSRTGEINLMNVSKGVLASSVDDPVRPSNKSPNTPPTTIPLPSEVKLKPSALNGALRSVSEGGVFVTPARPCSVLGIAFRLSALRPVLVATAWLTAAAWPASPAGFVACAAGLNGVNVDAAADVPAYPYIAAAS